ncbi:MAG: DNA-binding protein [Smithellaceae bacterium]
MSQSRILVDSNAYFRLAQSIHPLLNVEFGVQRFCLYCLKELQDEYDKNPRLINTFSWVNEPEYVKNRSHLLKITREEKPEIKRAYDFIRDYVRNVHPGVSKVDVLCLAHAEQLNIPVVTDDEEMRIAATAYNIKTFKTLELLRLMLDCDYIDIKKIREIATYWIYLNDRPKDFNVDYKKLFGETPPK